MPIERNYDGNYLSDDELADYLGRDDEYFDYSTIEEELPHPTNTSSTQLASTTA